ncbi:uncharacterized protein LOC113863715 [Abrus precatorius]|uniref:Uncharacterized protein LOC113863715 n=1 Tax=Abrus precatorius TaxID=3816 RepID=A0A8B8LD23_ABRPR|nr:uncharacterized protein LOC113863715 [Abrus precatorius]
MMSKSLLQLLNILLILSFVLSSATVQNTRRLLPNSEKFSTQTTSVELQGSTSKEFRNDEEMFDMVEGFRVEGRFFLESNDYPGTGANNRHDPKTPGRA